MKLPSSEIQINSPDFEFSQIHIEASKHYFPREAHDKVFAKNKFGCGYSGPMIIERDKLNPDNVRKRQRVRSGVNKVAGEIHASLTKGYDFAQPIPWVAYDPEHKFGNKDYIIIGGRNRYDWFTINNKQYMLVDVFNVPSLYAFDMMAMYENTYAVDKVRGVADLEDIKTFFTSLAEDGEMNVKMTKNADDNYKRVYAFVVETVEMLDAEIIIKPSMRAEITRMLLEKTTGFAPFSSYNGAEEIKDILKDRGFINSNEIVYVPMNTNPNKVDDAIIKARKDYPKAKEIRFIAFNNTLGAYGKTPTDEWQQRTFGFFDVVREKIEARRNAGFTYELPDYVKFYGCINMLPDNQWPIDSIVVYDDPIEYELVIEKIA